MFVKFILCFVNVRDSSTTSLETQRCAMEESSAFLTATLRMPRLAVAETDALAETPSDEL
jgi:hypothetical protein